jgi:hypothetical protein
VGGLDLDPVKAMADSDSSRQLELLELAGPLSPIAGTGQLPAAPGHCPNGIGAGRLDSSPSQLGYRRHRGQLSLEPRASGQGFMK